MTVLEFFLESITQIATYIGYGVMGIVGLAVLSMALSQYWWRVSSQDAKLAGAKMQAEHGIDAGVDAKLSDLLASKL